MTIFNFSSASENAHIFYHYQLICVLCLEDFNAIFWKDQKNREDFVVSTVLFLMV